MSFEGQTHIKLHTHSPFGIGLCRLFHESQCLLQLCVSDSVHTIFLSDSIWVVNERSFHWGLAVQNPCHLTVKGFGKTSEEDISFKKKHI